MGLIQELIQNPRETLIFLLLALPGRLLALSLHEFGHAWVANRCGDPTARLMGRMTVNPLKHIDPIGLFMMLFVGIGWAKPVPVNPNNFRNYRRDDLKVSLAGITMNLILFVLGCAVMFSFLGSALAGMPKYSSYNAGIMAGEEHFIAEYQGEASFFENTGEGYLYLPISELTGSASWIGQYAVTAAYGSVAGYVYQMLGYFVMVNIVLAIFNLIPLPPLDGYHVLNDLVLKRSLFADQRTMAIGSGIMLVLFFTGYLSQGLSVVENGIFSGVGALAESAFYALGIL